MQNITLPTTPRSMESTMSGQSTEERPFNMDHLIVSKEYGTVARQLQTMYEAGDITRAQLARDVRSLMGLRPNAATRPHEQLRPPEQPDRNRTAALEEFIAAQGEAQLHPWKGDYRRAKTKLAGFAQSITPEAWGETLKAMQASFIAQAKARTLTRMDVLLGQYLLFGEDELQAKRMLCHLLFTADKSKQVELHNWGLFALFPQAQTDVLGPRVAKLSEPLFPPGVCEELNIRLFAQNNEPLRGGGSTPARESLYAPEAQEQALMGGGTMAPIVNETGVQIAALDLEAMEAQMAQLEKAIAQLRQRNAQEAHYAYLPPTQQVAQQTRLLAPQQPHPTGAYGPTYAQVCVQPPRPPRPPRRQAARNYYVSGGNGEEEGRQTGQLESQDSKNVQGPADVRSYVAGPRN